PSRERRAVPYVRDAERRARRTRRGGGAERRGRRARRRSRPPPRLARPFSGRAARACDRLEPARRRGGARRGARSIAVTRRETPLDAAAILQVLARHGVEYVLIGGLAVQAH